MCAGKHRLANLTVIIDYNKQQSYDSTFKIQNLEPFASKWQSFGFTVKEVDGHDVSALRRMFRQLPFEINRPSALICHTVKGKGIPFVEGNLNWHHKSRISDDDIQALIQGLTGSDRLAL